MVCLTTFLLNVDLALIIDGQPHGLPVNRWTVSTLISSARILRFFDSSLVFTGLFFNCPTLYALD